MQKLFTSFFLSAILTAVPAGAATPATPSPSPQIDHVYVTEAGKYIVSYTQTDNGSTNGAAPTPTAHVRYLPASDAIHLGDNPRFGVRYSLVGSPDGADVEIKCVTIFPKPGAQKPGAAAPLPREESTWPRALGDAYYCGYAINDNWQKIPGDWTFEIWHGDKKLATQTFNLVP